MTRTLDELYLTWLYRQVGSGLKTSRRTYWKLFGQLYSKEFVWLIGNDDNRAEDGKDLRNEFAAEEEVCDPDGLWSGLGCSFLEMLVGLSRRLSFETDREPREWFWELLKNLNLDSLHDKGRLNTAQVDEILDTVIWRTYTNHGVGGLFPLENECDDQREVELWYQMCAYLLEKGY